eukprot:NODE_21983_length_727_cov_4.546667.p1 GENE.NODE_21983_length_727_cov_4.546667~~NODE_21983_length_727_cov_4.546667.p1  ORF type:complete len:178 (-),score=22.05 NODE_21983_length_727_cov_4.546667:115-648(-)
MSAVHSAASHKGQTACRAFCHERNQRTPRSISILCYGAVAFQFVSLFCCTFHPFQPSIENVYDAPVWIAGALFARCAKSAVGFSRRSRTIKAHLYQGGGELCIVQHFPGRAELHEVVKHVLPMFEVHLLRALSRPEYAGPNWSPRQGTDDNSGLDTRIPFYIACDTAWKKKKKKKKI